jgi:hypothetical protein
MVVLDVADDQVEVLRIEENLRRRTLKISEAARAVRRLYELAGIKQGKRPSLPAEPTSIPVIEVDATPE